MWIMIVIDRSILSYSIPSYRCAHTHNAHIWNIVYSQPTGNGAIAHIQHVGRDEQIIVGCTCGFHVHPPFTFFSWDHEVDDKYWWMTPMFQHFQLRKTEFTASTTALPEKKTFLGTQKSSSSRVNPGRISHRTEGFLLSSLMRCLSRDGDLNRWRIWGLKHPDRNQFHVAIAFTHKLGDFEGTYSEKLVEFGKPMP